MNFKIPAIRSEKHLAFVRSHDCIINDGKGNNCNGTPVVAHHLTFLKNSRGMSKKAGDDKTIHICWQHHSKLHSTGEKRFWLANGFTLEEIENIVQELWEMSNGRI